MAPRRPSPPKHVDPEKHYPGQAAETISDLREHIERARDTLSTAVSISSDGSQSEEDEAQLLMSLLSVLARGCDQVDDARRLVAEYAMRGGLTQTKTAIYAKVSNGTAYDWYHRPKAAEDLAR